MSRKRLKYYGWSDSQIQLICEYVVQKNATDKISNDINDFIELYNVLLYIGEIKLSIPEKDIEKFKKESREKIGRYFSQNKLSDFKDDYKTLESIYIKDFWYIFVDYQLINKTSAAEFEQFVSENEVHMTFLLNSKSISNKYKTVLKALLLKKPRYFELFLDKHDSKRSSDLYLPNNFTSEEIDNWSRRYCELSDANSNYLGQISLWSNKHDYKISDEVILKARRAQKEILNNLFDPKNGMEWSMGVSIEDDLEDDFTLEKISNTSYIIKFNRTWLKDNLEYPTILNNFIYFFNFFSYRDGFSFIGSQNEPESLLDLLGTRSKFEYPMGEITKTQRNLFNLIFYAYFDFLQYEGIDLETVFKFYYETYLSNELGIKEFFFNSSSKNSSFYERGKAIIPELDSILKQFDLFREFGEIDIELFELRSKNKNYSLIESFSDKKFVYLHSEETKVLCRLLFSTQSPLSYIEDGEGNNFCEKIINGVSKEVFLDHQKSYLDKLISDNILGINVGGQLYFKNLEYVSLLHILWSRGYFCMLYPWSEELILLVDEHVLSGDLRYGNTLFSEQESDYISFIMDDKKFSNGLSIRNKFTHGSFAKKSADEHKQSYLELLVILLLYTLRINQELEHFKNDDR